MSSRVLAFVFLTLGVAAAAQTPPAATPPAAATQPTPSAATPSAPPALEPRGFTYSSEGRRDPFVSLLQRGSAVETSAPVRVPGLAGLGAAEVTLKGTVASQGGYVAILRGVDAKTYIVRAGEKLSDGTVRAITPDTVVILQQVSDPLAADTQREVRNTLRQTEEAK
jgi:Tfp pilus assembly protein PilP